MDSAFISTTRTIDEIQEFLFPRLESAMLKQNASLASTIEKEIEEKLGQIDVGCDKIEIYVNKEPPSRRAQSKMRLDQLKYDRKHLSSALNNLKHRRLQREKEDAEREELLTRRFTTNSETNIPIEQDNYYADEHSRLTGFHRHVDDMLSQGSSVLANLKDQRSLLSGAHRKLMQIGNTLGLSNTVMRLIEKRAYGDKFILFGGMIAITILMFIIWRFLT